MENLFGKLVVIDKNSDKHKEYFLKNDSDKPNIIGRYSKSTTSEIIGIETNDDTVSRQHCKIEIVGPPKKYRISDLGSENGTILIKGDKPEQQLKLVPGDMVYISDGDEICLGNTRLRLVLPSPNTVVKSIPPNIKI